MKFHYDSWVWMGLITPPPVVGGVCPTLQSKRVKDFQMLYIYPHRTVARTPPQSAWNIPFSVEILRGCTSMQNFTSFVYTSVNYQLFNCQYNMSISPPLLATQFWQHSHTHAQNVALSASPALHTRCLLPILTPFPTIYFQSSWSETYPWPRAN